MSPNSKTSTPVSNGSPPHDGGVKVNGKPDNPGMRKFKVPNWRGPPATSGNLADEADPFVDAGSPAAVFGALNLSAKAKSFTPTTSSIATPVGVLSVGTEADGPVIVHSGRASMPATISSRRAPTEPIGSKSQSASPPRIVARFSTDVDRPGPGGHFIQVQNVQNNDLGAKGIFTKLLDMPQYDKNVIKKGKFNAVKASSAGADFVVFIFSDSLAYTTNLFSMLDAEAKFACRIISQHAYAAAVGISKAPVQYCGQITLKAQFKGLTSKFAADRIANRLEELLGKFGKVVAFAPATEAEFPFMKYRAEFESVSSASQAIAAFKQGTAAAADAGIDDLTVEAYQYEPPTFGNTPEARTGSTTLRHQSGGTISPTTVGTPSTSRSGSGSKETLIYSPTGRTAEREDANGNIVTAPGKVRVERCERSSQDAGQHPSQIQQIAPFCGNTTPMSFDPHQRFEAHDVHENYMLRSSIDGRPLEHRMCGPQDVDVGRIMAGHDVRTTLMIRNIPSDWTADQLIDVLKACVPGLYDFTYLRIDFQQGSAVGYGFVNFTTANALLIFVQANVNRPLPSMPGGKLNRKPCQVSYANIQGYECLIAKFRNSSIMQEAFTCRPMLWHSEVSAPTPAQIGQQLEFPAPDNNAKLQRSIENAGSQGLYAPRPRGAGRDGRRQHSQWDRGTPGQVHDEQQFFNYNNNQQYTWAPGAPMYPPYGQQISPAYGGSQYMMQPPVYGMPQYQQPIPQPSPHFHGYNQHAASGLRTHTNGQLGFRYDTLPAFIAPAGAPYGTGVVMNREADFEPMPTANGSTPRFFRERTNSGRNA